MKLMKQRDMLFVETEEKGETYGSKRTGKTGNSGAGG